MHRDTGAGHTIAWQPGRMLVVEGHVVALGFASELAPELGLN